MFQNWSNVTKNVSSWLGATASEDENEPTIEIKRNENGNNVEKQMVTEKENMPKKTEVNIGNNDENVPGISEQLEEVSTKAISSAKEWGSYLFGVGKLVGEKAAATALSVKSTVEENTILGEFDKEQEKFKQQKQESRCKSEVSVAPWVGFNEEEEMKSQILALSSDTRNFLRSPPSGVQFQFDFSTSYPVAMAILQEDQRLNKMRFELVPKKVKEDVFWRNYFYRVSLIKQSAQLSSLQQPGRGEGDKIADKKTSSSLGQELSSSPTEHEFISDDYNEDINQEELRKDMQQLGVDEEKSKTSPENDEPEWDKLAAELQEYDIVTDANDEIDQEILEQIERESST